MVSAIQRRFNELTAQAAEVSATIHMVSDPMTGRLRPEVATSALLSWQVKAHHLLNVACGQSTPHVSSFVAAGARAFLSSAEAFAEQKAVFAAAKEDFEGGLLVSLRTLVQAELFDSELEQAEELWRAGYLVPAAVIAGTVLETTLRELCARSGVSVGSANRMNDDLAKAAVYNSLRHKHVSAMAAVRNSAAHGRSDEFSRDDVERLIQDVRRFVDEQLAT